MQGRQLNKTNTLQKQVRQLEMQQSSQNIEYDRELKLSKRTISTLEKTISNLKKDLEFVVKKEAESFEKLQLLKKQLLELKEEYYGEKSAILARLAEEQAKTLQIEESNHLGDRELLVENKKLTKQLYQAQNDLQGQTIRVCRLIRIRNFWPKMMN